MKDLLVTFGDEVKVTSSGKVSGYLIRFGGTDLDGDFFTQSCDFGRPTNVGDSFKMNLYYAHGMDDVVGKETVGTGRVVVKDAGLWYEGQIEISDEYRKMIAKLGQEGRLGFSSGAASHLVERKSVGNASQIIRWNLAEASLTPKPAEPRNMASVKSLKSLVEAEVKASPSDLKVGDFVQWQSSGGTAVGKIERVATNATLYPEPRGNEIVGMPDNPAYLVRVISSMNGQMGLSDITVVHRAGTLTKIENPMKCGGGMMPSPQQAPQVVLVRPRPYTYAFPVRAEARGMNTITNNAPMSEEEMMRRRYMVPREDAMQGYMPVLPNTTAYPAVQGYMPVLSPSTHYPAMQSMEESYAPQGYMQTVPMVGYGRPQSGSSCKCGYPMMKGMAFCPNCGSPSSDNMMAVSPVVPCKACGKPMMKGMAYCPSCGSSQMKDDGMMPMGNGEGEGDKPDVHVTPQVLSGILSSLMQAYYEMVQALSEGEEEGAYDSYHGKLMKEWDMFTSAGKSFLSERVRPLNEVQSIPVTFSKSKPLTVSEFEKRVRDVFGLSRREAKTVASHGWKALCDAGVAALTDEVDSESKAIIWEDAPQVEEPVVQDATEVIAEEPVKKPRKKQVATPVTEPVAEEVAPVEEAKSVNEIDDTDADDDNSDDNADEPVVAAEVSEEAKAISEAKRETLMRQLLLQQLASQEG